MSEETSEAMTVQVDVLREFMERIEHLERRKDAITSDISEVYKEAKDAGLNTKAMKRLVTERKRDEAVVQTEHDILETYREAMV